MNNLISNDVLTCRVTALWTTRSFAVLIWVGSSFLNLFLSLFCSLRDFCFVIRAFRLSRWGYDLFQNLYQDKNEPFAHPRPASYWLDPMEWVWPHVVCGFREEVKYSEFFTGQWCLSFLWDVWVGNSDCRKKIKRWTTLCVNMSHCLNTSCGQSRLHGKQKIKLTSGEVVLWFM